MPLRLLVLGLPASGKSTFAQALAQKLRASHIEVDHYFWQGNSPRPPAQFEPPLRAAIDAADHWIVEGHFGKIRHWLLPQVETLVWLNYPLPVVGYRWFKRSLRCGDFNDWRYLTRERRELQRQYRAAAQTLSEQHRNVLILSHPREAKTLLGYDRGPLTKILDGHSNGTAPALKSRPLEFSD